MVNKNTAACSAAEGTLPGACASLVFPYVAMQGANPDRYNQNEALAAGTLFPGLRMPFFKETQARMNCSNTALCELMALDFAINELGLYLDTHSDDTEALQLYTNYVTLAKEGRQRYEATYGPLQQTAVSLDSGYTWLDDPWPWDAGNGGRK